MIDKSLRKATVEQHGPMVVVRMTGGPDCLWMNMYLDTEDWQMTCNSDIGFYAYDWGKPREEKESFIGFCCRWLSNKEWLLRKCVKEMHVEKDFDAEASRKNILDMFLECNGGNDGSDDINEAFDYAETYSENREAWMVAFESRAESLDVELPEEWWCCIVEKYSAQQKRFAEICAEVIVPKLRELIKSNNTKQGGADGI